MDDAQLREAYKKTAWHRMAIPFEQAVALPGVRTALEGSARRSTQSTAQPAKSARRRT